MEISHLLLWVVANITSLASVTTAHGTGISRESQGRYVGEGVGEKTNEWLTIKIESMVEYKKRDCKTEPYLIIDLEYRAEEKTSKRVTIV